MNVMSVCSNLQDLNQKTFILKFILVQILLSLENVHESHKVMYFSKTGKVMNVMCH